MRKDEDKVIVTSPDSLALYAESKGYARLRAHNAWFGPDNKWVNIFDIAQLFLKQYKTT